MGRKRAGGGKHLFLHIACCMTMLIGFGGCVHFPKEWQGEKSLATARNLMAKGNYQASLRESKEVLRLFPDSLGNQALFQMGLIYAHPENPNPDYQKALKCFQIVTDQSPKSSPENENGIWVSFHNKSSLKDEACIWASLLEKIVNDNKEINKSKEDIDLLEKTVKKKSRRIRNLQKHIRQLRIQIKRLKEIDLGIEEKKRRDLL